MGPSGSEPRPVAGRFEEYRLLRKFNTLVKFSLFHRLHSLKYTC